MAKSIIINAKANVMRAAVIEDRKLDNLFIDKTDKSRLIGNLYVGKIDRVLPDIQAAFVDIGIGKNGFLHKDDFIPDRYESLFRKGKTKKGTTEFNEAFKAGKYTLVQVAKDEIGTKGVRLVTDISLPGRFIVLMPFGRGKVRMSRKIVRESQRQYIQENIIPKLNAPEGVDVILRTASSGVKIKFIKRDLDNLVKTWKQIVRDVQGNDNKINCIHEELDLVRKSVRDWLDDDVQRIYIDDRDYYESLKAFIKDRFANPDVKLRLYKESIDIFDKFGITRQIEKLYNKKVWLKCGGYIVIDKTEALVAIDVNTGRNVKAQGNKDPILETNLEASEEIARQLRLRNMGGIVIIDYIDMKQRAHQRDVQKLLTSHLETDKAKTRVFPFTRLGLIQMTRQRVEETWEQHYFSNCERCGGTGRILSIPVICDQLINQIKRYLFDHPAINLNIRAHSDVINFILNSKGFQMIEEGYGIEIGYLIDDDFHPEKYLVVRTDTGKNIIRYDP